MLPAADAEKEAAGQHSGRGRGGLRNDPRMDPDRRAAYLSPLSWGTLFSPQAFSDSTTSLKQSVCSDGHLARGGARRSRALGGFTLATWDQKPEQYPKQQVQER